MRAKTVNESYGDKVSYKEAIEFVKDAGSKMGERQKFMGPSVRDRMDGSKYVDYYGGVARYYNSNQVDELLEAMQLVEDTLTNVEWSVSAPSNDYDSFRVNFSSDEQKKSDAAFAKEYRSQKGHWRGD